jgi:hypothetical protein
VTEKVEEQQAEKEYVPPAVYFHCLSVYERMLAQAKLVRAVEVEDDEEQSSEGDMIVYEGALTSLVTQELHLSVPYYTSVTRALKAMGCVKQLRRGGGQALSQWLLLREPTVELYQEMTPETVTASRRSSSKTDQLAQRISDHDDRLGTLEDFMNQIIDHFGTEEVKG